MRASSKRVGLVEKLGRSGSLRQRPKQVPTDGVYETLRSKYPCTAVASVAGAGVMCG